MIFDRHVYCENVDNSKNCAKIDSYRATFGLQPPMTTLFSSIRFHRLAYHTNLIVQKMWRLPLVIHLENQITHSYFAHSFKRHLEFTKLIACWKQNKKIFFQISRQDGFQCWALPRVMAKYVALLVKVALGQAYKAINQVELWTLMWPSSLVWTCLHFFIIRIYACFH
jgi:hypothetical protein